MTIYNTAPYFINNYQPNASFLHTYHATYPLQFKEYFLYHCKNPEEKKKTALQKYASHMNAMKVANQNIEKHLYTITSAYEKKYNIVFNNNVHIIVGLYGSNAFTHRQPIPDVTFCLEKLSPVDEHLKVIVAHEFGHVLHHMLSEQREVDWGAIPWFHPYTTLFQEGSATYLSEQLEIAKNQGTYFTYDDTGERWLAFSKKHKREIIRAFLSDMQTCHEDQIYREWFSIYGGTQFGYSRLGYFIGYELLHFIMKNYPELEAITIWRNANYIGTIHSILLEMSN